MRTTRPSIVAETGSSTKLNELFPIENPERDVAVEADLEVGFIHAAGFEAPLAPLRPVFGGRRPAANGRGGVAQWFGFEGPGSRCIPATVAQFKKDRKPRCLVALYSMTANY